MAAINTQLFKKRKRDSHKGDYGRLLIVAGSKGMAGAAYLSAYSALRSGCGLVYVACPESICNIVQRKIPEAIVRPLKETKAGVIAERTLSNISDLLDKVDAAVVGPGLGVARSTSKFLNLLFKNIKKSILIDADAINILSQDINRLKKIKAEKVITPHPGEMRRLIRKRVSSQEKERKKVAFFLANEYNTTVVLKGHRTVVADSKRLSVNRTGNPGMATAGSGDVLSGIIGSLLAQKADTFLAAKVGVYLHGLAGDIAAKEVGEDSLIASDIINKIPLAIKKFKYKKIQPA